MADDQFSERYFNFRDLGLKLNVKIFR
jgi:hypothetical protein